MADPLADKETPWRDPAVLRELYVEQGMNTYEMADELNTSHPTISKWLDEHNLREISPINKERPWCDEDTMRELYEEQRMTVGEIASELDCSYSTAFKWINEHGIETRDVRDEATRIQRKKPPWHHYTKDGYEVVETSVYGSNKQARIHRLVMVAEHGIDAVKGKIVHHKNEVPWDNRPSNLELMTTSEHTRHHRPIDSRWGRQTPQSPKRVDDPREEPE